MNSRGTSLAARPWRALAWTLGLAALCLGLAAVPVNAGQPTYIDGIDVSHWQGSPDWAAATADGVHFAIAKATEGQTIVDNEYVRNRAQADALGLPFTAYHFAQPDTTANDAVLEADHFLANAMLKGRHLVPVLDLEQDNGLSPKKLRTWVKSWLARVHQRLGVKAIIYTSPAFWIDEMGNSRWFADNGHRLWIAHWNVDSPTVPADNWGSRGWTLWQHAVVGGLDGFNGKVDRDRYAGTTFGPLKIKNNR